mgnify:CR=1 FL=1
MGVKVSLPVESLVFERPSGERYNGVLEGLQGKERILGELLVGECLELEGLRNKLLERSDAQGFVFVSRELNRCRLALLDLGRDKKGALNMGWLFSEEQREALERSKYGGV